MNVAEEKELKRISRQNTLQVLSDKTTQFLRQMVLAGIGVIWILLNLKINNLALINLLSWALLLLCCSLLSELLHYVCSMLIYYFRARWPKMINKDGKIVVKDLRGLMAIPWSFFIIKVLCAIIAYVILLIAIFSYKDILLDTIISTNNIQ